MKIVQCLSSSLDSSATSSKNCGTKGHMIPKENLFKIKLYSSGVLVSTTVKRGVLRLQTMRPKLPQDVRHLRFVEEIWCAWTLSPLKWSHILLALRLLTPGQDNTHLFTWRFGLKFEEIFTGLILNQLWFLKVRTVHHHISLLFSFTFLNFSFNFLCHIWSLRDRISTRSPQN